jgi:hypothetical protein
MKIRYYKTKLEGKDEDRFEMLAKLIDEEKEYDHLHSTQSISFSYLMA